MNTLESKVASLTMNSLSNNFSAEATSHISTSPELFPTKRIEQQQHEILEHKILEKMKFTINIVNLTAEPHSQGENPWLSGKILYLELVQPSWETQQEVHLQNLDSGLKYL